MIFMYESCGGKMKKKRIKLLPSNHKSQQQNNSSPDMKEIFAYWGKNEISLQIYCSLSFRLTDLTQL